MTRTFWLLGLLGLSSLALADDATSYHYGMPLDIARVIAISAPSGCEVGEATLRYQDSQGAIHTLTYLRQGEDCID